MDFKTWIENRAAKDFFILITLQLIFLLALFITDVLTNIDNDNVPTDNEKNCIDNPELCQRDAYFKWLILFIFQISDYYYAWNSILKQNVLELFAFLIIELATLGATYARFIGLNSNQIVAGFNYAYLTYSTLIMILSAICAKSFFDAFYASNILKVGASMKAQSKQSNIIEQYRDYTYFTALLKLYFQLSCCSFVGFYFFVGEHWYYYVIYTLMISLQLLSFGFGYLGLNQENKTYLIIYASLISFIQIFIIATSIYCVFFFNDYIDELDDYTKIIIGSTTLACMILLSMDFYFLIQCYQGFGQGLKQALQKSRANSELEQEMSV